MRLSVLAAVAACFAFAVNAPARAETVVEYYNATLDHYFITPLADEIDALDSGRIAAGRAPGSCSTPSASPA